MPLPVFFDGRFELVRRALRRENVLEAHRFHLYQRCVQAGLSRRNPLKPGASHQKVALAYTAWAAVSGGAALLVHFGQLKLLLAYAIVLIPAAALLIHSRRFPK